MIFSINVYQFFGKISVSGLKHTYVDGSRACTLGERSRRIIPMRSGVPQGFLIGPLFFLPFGNNLPYAFEALTLLFADDLKMVTLRTQNNNLYSSLTAEWGWSQKLDLLINPTKCNYLTIGRDVPLRLSFSRNGPGTHLPVSKLVKYQRVQTGKAFAPSGQIAEDGNKAKRFNFTIRRSFQDLSKLDFIPLYDALVRPHL